MKRVSGCAEPKRLTAYAYLWRVVYRAIVLCSEYMHGWCVIVMCHCWPPHSTLLALSSLSPAVICAIRFIPYYFICTLSPLSKQGLGGWMDECMMGWVVRWDGWIERVGGWTDLLFQSVHCFIYTLIHFLTPQTVSKPKLEFETRTKKVNFNVRKKYEISECRMFEIRIASLTYTHARAHAQ